MIRRFIPRSIRGRLFAAAILFTGLALLFASVSIGSVLERFSKRGLDERLDAQIVLAARAVRPDASIDRSMLADIAAFSDRRHGWGWRIETPVERATSDEFRIAMNRPGGPGHRHGPDWRDDSRGDPYTRTMRKPTARGDALISAHAPRAFSDNIRRSIILPWATALGTLAVFLLLATFLQLRIGLKPLTRLKAALGDVRSGRAARIPEDQPVELREVVIELNSLLDENAEALARARGHVANMAHSLKTPLATLSLKLREGAGDPGGELSDLVAQIERGIRHHLGRARAASPGAPGEAAIDLLPAAEALVAVLGRIHGERDISATVTIAPGLRVKCDPQDLDEMLGNLLDNAWKWAASKIAVGAHEDGATVAVTIDDDGPGLPPDAIDHALVRGQRLDEQGEGHGFGLPIARELAELHGGTLDLGPSPLGGLRATLTLPR